MGDERGYKTRAGEWGERCAMRRAEGDLGKGRLYLGAPGGRALGGEGGGGGGEMKEDLRKRRGQQ